MTDTAGRRIGSVIFGGRVRRRRLWHLDEGGSTLIEFAFASTVLLVLMYGILEFGRVLYLQNQLQQGVAMAARWATVTSGVCSNTSQIQSYASARSSVFLTIPAADFTVNCNAGCGNNVSVAYPFSFTIPFYGTTSLNLTAQSCYPK